MPESLSLASGGRETIPSGERDDGGGTLRPLGGGTFSKGGGGCDDPVEIGGPMLTRLAKSLSDFFFWLSVCGSDMLHLRASNGLLLPQDHSSVMRGDHDWRS